MGRGQGLHLSKEEEGRGLLERRWSEMRDETSQPSVSERDEKLYPLHTMAPPPFESGATRLVTQVPSVASGYGSTTVAAALVGVKPGAKVGPTVQVLLDWLYSSE